MSENSTRIRAIVGCAIGLNLLLGVGAAAGVVPLPGTTQSVAAVDATPVDAVAVAQPAAEPEVAGSEPAPAPPETAPASTAPTVAAAKPTTTVAPEPVAPPVTSAPATTAAPRVAARPYVSSAQVQAATAQLQARNPMFNVTEDQARQFGDQICDAFDAGSSYSQVRAQVMQAAASAPLAAVSTADADFAIRSAVQLFCPGYLSKLS